jgi:glycerol uptake facilitator-like aquaporin
MAYAAVESLSAYMTNLAKLVPPGLGMALAPAFIQGGEYFSAFRHEFVGSLLMIACTFSAGKWIGTESMRMAWTSHFLGVITSDFLGGGPQVNPAVTMSMWCLGKVSYTEAYVRVAGQIGGGLVAFPLYHALSDAMKWVPFGGPEFNAPADTEHAVEAFLSETGGTFLLMFVIYILNWELNFGKFHYIIKQSLTAIAIRTLIEIFPTSGPSMNPVSLSDDTCTDCGFLKSTHLRTLSASLYSLFIRFSQTDVGDYLACIWRWDDLRVPRRFPALLCVLGGSFHGGNCC